MFKLTHARTNNNIQTRNHLRKKEVDLLGDMARAICTTQDDRINTATRNVVIVNDHLDNDGLTDEHKREILNRKLGSLSLLVLVATVWDPPESDRVQLRVCAIHRTPF